MTSGRISLHEQIVDAFGADLTDGHIAPGDVLSTEALMQRYGASRTIIREVVKVLEQHGVAVSRRRVGVIVQPESEWAAMSPMIVHWRLASSKRPKQLRELSEFRSGIEPAAAGLAAMRATDAQRERIMSAAVGMSRTGPQGDLEGYLHHDIIFHTTILEGSMNAAFASFSALVAKALTGRTQHDLMPSIPKAEAIEWHFDVAKAIATGDSRTAEESMRHIVGEATAAMVEAMTPGVEEKVETNVDADVEGVVDVDAERQTVSV